MKNAVRANGASPEGPMSPDRPTAPEDTAPVRVAGEAGRTPFVFASPHSGRRVPGDMGAAPGLSTEEIGSADDVLVDGLIAAGAEMGAVLVLGQVSRAYIDVNRAPDEIDPELTPGAGEAGARASGGYGLIHRLSGRGRPLYDRAVSLEETQARIAAVHGPYHAALTEAVEAARSRFGYAVLIDWHSMPSRADVRGLAQVVIGDRHGASCTAGLSREARRLFEGAGLITALNRPYAGGWTTQRWGRPLEGLHALQIEIARGLYLDERGTGVGQRFDWTRKAVERVMTGLLALPASTFLPGQKKTAAGAAVESL